MDEVLLRPEQVRAEDIDPHYRWNRALPALGPMGVDFEERVDFQRLHRYRLGRARQALEASGLGGLRGTVPPAFGLMRRHAEEIAGLLREAGVADMPLGVDIIEPPMMFE